MGLIIEIIFGLVCLIIILMNLGLLLKYNNLKQISNETKLSGFEIAKTISLEISEEEPHIIKKNGRFLDHYNIERNVIKLSPEVFDGENLYAALVALNIALKTDKSKNSIAKKYRFVSFIVIVAYLMIILGAFLNNVNIIHMGFILFILAFLFNLLLLNFEKREEKELYQWIKKKNLIEPYEDNKNSILLMILMNIARFPYEFINYIK